MTGLIQTNPSWQPLVSRSENSGDNHGEEAVYGGMGNSKKKYRAPKRPLFQKGPEDAISSEVWKNYAHLASLMDAVSLIQTKMQFLEMAEKALGRMRILNEQSHLESPTGDKQEYLSLAGFLAKLSQKSFNGLNLFFTLELQQSVLSESDLILKENPTNDSNDLRRLSCLFEVPEKGKKVYAEEEKLEDCAKIVSRNKKNTKDHLEHLQKLVDSARTKIENLDHCYLTLQGKVKAMAQTQTTRESILDHSNQAMLAQTTLLPRKALHLIDS